MTEAREQTIIDAAKACERHLWLASMYDLAGQLADAATCYEVAEAESDLAFAFARGL